MRAKSPPNPVPDDDSEDGEILQAWGKAVRRNEPSSSPEAFGHIEDRIVPGVIANLKCERRNATAAGDELERSQAPYLCGQPSGGVAARLLHAPVPVPPQTVAL